MKKSSTPRKIKTEIKIEKTPLSKKVRWPIIMLVLLVLSNLFKVSLKVLKQPVVLAVLLVLLAGSSVYLFAKYQKAQTELTKIKENPQAVAQSEIKSLVAKVGQLIALPDKETPTVATITDVAKLKSQPFFAKAKNGDKVLIYTQAKKAILYRPSINKVIEVGPINIAPNTPQATSSATVTPSLTPTATQ